MWEWGPEAGSWVEILFVEWMPGLLAILVGGVLANRIFPKWQHNFEKNKQQTDRKYQLCERISEDFQVYINNLTRLHDFARMAKLEEERGGSLDASQRFERQQVYVLRRDESRDSLYSTFSIAPLYFSTETCRFIEDFERWHAGWTPEYDDYGYVKMGSFLQEKAKLINALRKEIENS